MPDLIPGNTYTVTDGTFAGAKVVFNFISRGGLADCRFAEDFGPHRKGEIIVVRPERLRPEETDAQA